MAAMKWLGDAQLASPRLIVRSNQADFKDARSPSNPAKPQQFLNVVAPGVGPQPASQKKESHLGVGAWTSGCSWTKGGLAWETLSSEASGQVHRMLFIDPSAPPASEFRTSRDRQGLQGGQSTSEPTVVTLSYQGKVTQVTIEKWDTDERIDSNIRAAFGMHPGRTICLREPISGAVTAANQSLPAAHYEIITDEDQDVVDNFSGPALANIISIESSQGDVKRALDLCGFSKILPELKSLTGAQLRSLPYENLVGLFGHSEWRMRAARTLYWALHAPKMVHILADGGGLMSRQTARQTVVIGCTRDFDNLLRSYGCSGFRPLGHERLAIRFEDMQNGHDYIPYQVHSRIKSFLLTLLKRKDRDV